MRTLGLALGLVVAACSQPSPSSPPPSPHPLTAAAPLRLLALGDSFTIGTGSAPARSFPARLAARWNDAGCAVSLRNLGVNGYTTADLTEAELPEVAGFSPDRVTLAIGANDIVHGASLEEYRGAVRRILAAVVAAGVEPRHVVALPQPDWSLSPAAAYFGDARGIAARIEAFNAALRDEARAAGAVYLDIFPLMRRQAEAKRIANDGLHPSADAYDAWAEAIAVAIPLPCKRE